VIHVDHPTQVPPARREVVRLGAAAGLTREDVDRLGVAVQEILANAILHGGGQARVSVDLHDGRFTVAVADQGSWKGTVPASRPDSQQLNGRGLWLARELCDDLTIVHTPVGTTVRLTMILSSARR
jgi:anti-sigma regulatory factor (Ser/Thr protein kinase)